MLATPSPTLSIAMIETTAATLISLHWSLSALILPSQALQGLSAPSMLLCDANQSPRWDISEPHRSFTSARLPLFSLRRLQNTSEAKSTSINIEEATDILGVREYVIVKHSCEKKWLPYKLFQTAHYLVLFPLRNCL